MIQTLITLLLWLLLLPGIGRAAGLPTFDAGLNAIGMKAEWDQLQKWWEMLKQTANQAKQLENQVRQIENQLRQIDQMRQSLTKMDMSQATSIFGMISLMEGRLSQAKYLGFLASNSVERAQALYPSVQRMLTPQEQQRLKTQQQAARRDTAQVGISIQAIVEAQRRMQTEWTTMLKEAQAAEGPTAIQQVQIKAQAAQAQHLMAIEQQLAMQAREQSMRTLEAVSKEEMEQALTDAALQPLEGAYVPQGRFIRGIRTGRE